MPKSAEFRRTLRWQFAAIARETSAGSGGVWTKRAARTSNLQEKLGFIYFSRDDQEEQALIPLRNYSGAAAAEIGRSSSSTCSVTHDDLEQVHTAPLGKLFHSHIVDDP